MFPTGLYAIADDGVRAPAAVEAHAEALLLGGVRVLQLRLKRTGSALALGLLRRLVARARASGCLLLVNDRVDWALLSGADGVHLGDEDLEVDEARQLLGPKAVVGRTVRDAAQARDAQARGADYVGAGPVFLPGSKVVEAPLLGLSGLALLVGDSPLPVVAIGGIGLSRMREVARAGAYGAAVVSDLLAAEDIAARVRHLAEEFLRGAEAHGRSLGAGT